MVQASCYDDVDRIVIDFRFDTQTRDLERWSMATMLQAATTWTGWTAIDFRFDSIQCVYAGDLERVYYGAHVLVVQEGQGRGLR